MKTIIKPSRGFNFKKIQESFEYKDLLYFLVLKEIKVLYKQTILGFGWAILRPVISMLIFTIIFGKVAKIPSDGIPYPIFSYVALVPWIFFASSMTKSSQSLIANSSVFTKVYFPRIFLPIAPVLAGLIDFFIALGIVFIMMIWYQMLPTINLFFLPFLIAIMILTSSGIGFFLSALAVQYRDIRNAMQFFTQLLMYVTPVVWPLSILENKISSTLMYLYSFYPMVGVIDGFRSVMLGSNSMPWEKIFIGFISSLIIFFSGLIYFSSKEKIFADVA